jgi:hypothetical protein
LGAPVLIFIMALIKLVAGFACKNKPSNREAAKNAKFLRFSERALRASR